MTNIEIISNDYHNMVTKKIYELISLTSFYYDEMDWSLSNFRYYYKNIKLILMIYLIIFFDYILFFIFLFIIYSFIWKI
jgi:hypothetical protein